MKQENNMANSKKCAHMQLQNQKTRALGEEEINMPICKVKDDNLYSTLLAMGYESSFFSAICPFCYQMDKIAECPRYKEK